MIHHFISNYNMVQATTIYNVALSFYIVSAFSKDIWIFYNKTQLCTSKLLSCNLFQPQICFEQLSAKINLQRSENIVVEYDGKRLSRTRIGWSFLLHWYNQNKTKVRTNIFTYQSNEIGRVAFCLFSCVWKKNDGNSTSFTHTVKIYFFVCKSEKMYSWSISTFCILLKRLILAFRLQILPHSYNKSIHGSTDIPWCILLPLCTLHSLNQLKSISNTYTRRGLS